MSKAYPNLYMYERNLQAVKDAMLLRNYSPRTWQAYIPCLYAYFEAVPGADHSFDEDKARSYLLSLRSQNLAPNTLNMHLCAIKFYVQHLLKRRARINILYG